ARGAHRAPRAACGSDGVSRASARRIGLGAAALVLCALVFALYLRPDMVFTLANAVWNCF
ncbi:MAG: hypothetical protein OEW27_16535, partial [Aquincola sp.]|nr:hypothetical protein [Aquincola sp.]